MTNKLDDMSNLAEMLPALTNRRRFLSYAGLGTLGALGASKLGALEGPLGSLNEKAGVTQGDIDILNFALNLEYLEAEYYLRAAFGRGLDDADTTGTGTRGDVTGGSEVPFTNDTFRDYAAEIANDEEDHVKFLRAALGSAAVARPTIDLDQSFTNAAIAAGLISAGQTFDPFADQNSFLLGAFIFEDVGVTAYHGAAPLIKNKQILAAAAGILAVEAYHAGEIRTILYSLGLIKEAKAISDLRDAADGKGDLDQPIRLQGHANIIPTDSNGLAFSRSTAQVLNIVYLGGAAANFGFFPDKLNGNIK
jgi:Ferritin-like domain